MNKKYQIIYADPPWRYEFANNRDYKIEGHYPSMATEDICKIRCPAEKNSVLFLWATAPKLQEAMEVIKSWGFQYKTNAIWDKVKIGLGFWFRGQHELLLVATKGQFSPSPKELLISSVIREPKKEHSRKPSFLREIINKWYPDETKLEMFARKDDQIDLWGKNTFDGWDVWGNEVESDIDLGALKNKQ